MQAGKLDKHKHTRTHNFGAFYHRASILTLRWHSTAPQGLLHQLAWWILSVCCEIGRGRERERKKDMRERERKRERERERERECASVRERARQKLKVSVIQTRGNGNFMPRDEFELPWRRECSFAWLRGLCMFIGLSSFGKSLQKWECKLGSDHIQCAMEFGIKTAWSMYSLPSFKKKNETENFTKVVLF